MAEKTPYKHSTYKVSKNASVDLSSLPTRDKALFDGDKQEGLQLLDGLAKEIAGLQDLLFANGKYRMLIVLQGMDGAGKSSTIRDIFRYCNSLGVHACSFGKPSEEELKRDYLWRIHAHTPRRGEIGIFDRSHYEDITTVKVLDLVDNKQIKKRQQHILDFEQMLVDEDTIILKFFLHLSRSEQAEQLRERLEDKSKSYKFNPADLDARAKWDDYQDVWAKAIEKTSTAEAPWYVIPADRRWYRKLAIAQVVRDALADLKLRWPEYDMSQEERTQWISELS